MSFDTTSYSSLGRKRLHSYSPGSSRSSYSSDYGSRSSHGFSPGFSSLGSTTSLSTCGLSGSMYSSRPPSSFASRSREEPFISTSMIKRDTIINSLVRTSHELTRHDFLPADAASRSTHLMHLPYRPVDRSRSKTADLSLSSLTARGSSDFSCFSSFAATSSYETSYRSPYRPILIQRPTFDNYTPRPLEERQRDIHFKSIRRDRPLVKFREREEVNPEKVKELLDSWTPETIEEHEDEDYETKKRDSVRSNDSGIGSFRNSFGKRSRRKSGEFPSCDLSPTIDEKDSGTEDNEDLSNDRRFGRYTKDDHVSSVDEGVHMEAEYESRSPRDVVSPLDFHDVNSRPLSRNDISNTFEKHEGENCSRGNDSLSKNSEFLVPLVETDEQHPSSPETKPPVSQRLFKNNNRVRRRSDLDSLETLENTSSEAALANSCKTLTTRRRDLKPESNVAGEEHTKIGEIEKVKTDKDTGGLVYKTEKVDKTTSLSRARNVEKAVKTEGFEISTNETEVKTEISSSTSSLLKTTGQSKIPPSNSKFTVDNKTESMTSNDIEVKLSPKKADEKIMKKNKLKSEGDKSNKTEVLKKSLPSPKETSLSEMGCRIKDTLNASPRKITTESPKKTTDSSKLESSGKTPVELPSKTTARKRDKMPVETPSKTEVEKPRRISIGQTGNTIVESPGKNKVESPNKVSARPFGEVKIESPNKAKAEIPIENTTEPMIKNVEGSFSKRSAEESPEKPKIKQLRTETSNKTPVEPLNKFSGTNTDKIPPEKIASELSNKKLIESPAKSVVETTNIGGLVGSPNKTKLESPNTRSKLKDESFSKSVADAPSKTKIESLSKIADNLPCKTKLESLSKTAVDSPSKTKFESLSKITVDSPGKTKLELSKTQTVPPRKAKVEPFTKTPLDSPSKMNGEPFSKPPSDSYSKTEVESLSKTAVDSTSKTKLELSKARTDPSSKSKDELSTKTPVDSPTKEKVEPFGKAAADSHRKTKVESLSKTDDPFKKTEVMSLSKTAVDLPSKTKVELSKAQTDAPSKAKVEPFAKTPVDSPSKTKTELSSKAQGDSPSKAKVEPFSKAAVESSSKTKVESLYKLKPDVSNEGKDYTLKTKAKTVVFEKPEKLGIHSIVNDLKSENEQEKLEDRRKLTKNIGEITGAIPKTKEENLTKRDIFSPDKNKRSADHQANSLTTNKDEKQFKGSESSSSQTHEINDAKSKHCSSKTAKSVSPSANKTSLEKEKDIKTGTDTKLKDILVLCDNKTDKNIASENEITKLGISTETIAIGSSDTKKVNSAETDIVTKLHDPKPLLISSKENVDFLNTEGKDKFNIDRIKTKATVEEAFLSSEQEVLKEQTSKKSPLESENTKLSTDKNMTNLENDVSLRKIEKGVHKDLKESTETTNSETDMKTQKQAAGFTVNSELNKDSETQGNSLPSEVTNVTAQERSSSLSEKSSSGSVTSEKSVNELQSKADPTSNFENKQKETGSSKRKKSVIEEITTIAASLLDTEENIESQTNKIVTQKDNLVLEPKCASGVEEKSEEKLSEKSTGNRGDNIEICDSIPVIVEISDTTSQSECVSLVIKKSPSEDFRHDDSNTSENFKLQKSFSADTKVLKRTKPPFPDETVIPPQFLLPHEQPGTTDGHGLEKNTELHPLQKSSTEEKVCFKGDSNEMLKLNDLKKSSTDFRADSSESPNLHDLEKPSTIDCDSLIRKPPEESSQENQENSVQNSMKLDDEISLHNKHKETGEKVLEPKEDQTLKESIPGENKENSDAISAELSTIEDKNKLNQNSEVYAENEVKAETVKGEIGANATLTAQKIATEPPGKESDEEKSSTSLEIPAEVVRDEEQLPKEDSDAVSKPDEAYTPTSRLAKPYVPRNSSVPFITDLDVIMRPLVKSRSVPNIAIERVRTKIASKTELEHLSKTPADKVTPEHVKDITATDVLSTLVSVEDSFKTNQLRDANFLVSEDKKRQDQEKSLTLCTEISKASTGENDTSTELETVSTEVVATVNELEESSPVRKIQSEIETSTPKRTEAEKEVPPAKNEIKSSTDNKNLYAQSQKDLISKKEDIKDSAGEMHGRRVKDQGSRTQIAIENVRAKIAREAELERLVLEKVRARLLGKQNKTPAEKLTPKSVSADTEVQDQEKSSALCTGIPKPSTGENDAKTELKNASASREFRKLDESCPINKIQSNTETSTPKYVQSEQTSATESRLITTAKTEKNNAAVTPTVKERQDDDKMGETISNILPPKKNAEDIATMDSKVTAEEVKPKVKKPKKPKVEGEEKVKKKKKKKDNSEVTGEKPHASATETVESHTKENIASDKGCEESVSSKDLKNSAIESIQSNEKSECKTNCHKKCEKSIPHLCGVNEKLLSEVLATVKKDLSTPSSGVNNEASATTDAYSVNICNLTPPQSPAISDPEDVSDPLWSENKRSESSESFRQSRNSSVNSGTVRFRKYAVEDFHFLKVLGRGSYGKVMLAELKGNTQYFAVKCLKKDVVLEDNDVECTMIEKKVLAMGSNHPYLCTLFCTFQSQSHLFFVMEYLSGGDLMFHIQQSGRFDQDRARFYAAEIVCALKYLHKRGIVYRDAKLDNICLDAEGHIRLVDFGFCKLRIYKKECLPRNLCGTPDYMAPEIIKGHHYNQSVDWWSFGVLLYEMLIGQSPFNGTDEEELFWSVCNEEAYYPRFLSKEAKHLLILLLEKNPEKRLGMPGCVAGDIIYQPFFRYTNWTKVEKKEVKPPFRPKLKSVTDVSYFDSDFTMEKAMLTPIDKQILESMDQNQFDGFSYTNPHITD